MSHSAFDSLDALARQLPFHLDDVESVNECFIRWRADTGERDRELIDLWTYCFIRRYFLVKFIQEGSFNAADFDELVDVTFDKVDRFAGQVQQGDRFASWVSVICKNTYLNYLRRRRRSVPLQRDIGPDLVAEPPAAYGDSAHARLALMRAIGRLPGYLRECVRLRFVEGLSYDDIAARTGYPLPRIRSYINKAMKRFRTDAELMESLEREN